MWLSFLVGSYKAVTNLLSTCRGHGWRSASTPKSSRVLPRSLAISVCVEERFYVRSIFKNLTACGSLETDTAGAAPNYWFFGGWCMNVPTPLQLVKSLPIMQEAWVWFLGWEDPLEKEMATHSSIIAWRIPWTEEPGRWLSLGSQELDVAEHTHTYTLSPRVGWFWALCFVPFPWVSHGFNFSWLIICPPVAPLLKSLPNWCFLHVSNGLRAFKSLFFKNPG